MKRIVCLLLSLILILPAVSLAELEEEDLGIDDLEIEEFDPDEGIPSMDVSWDFPVALEDMKPEYLILVNNHYRVSKKFVVSPLVKISNMKLKNDGSKKSGDMFVLSKGMKLNETCASALIELSDAAREDGFGLYLKSAYRTYGQQAKIYERHTTNGKNDGWAVKPGGSDHQTGLGCEEPECVWMAEHCAEYGFIIRYPDGKQAETEVNYEPWHLRYVGIPAATYIMENGLCLEEFTEQLQQAIQDYLDAGGDPAKVEAYIQKPTEE